MATSSEFVGLINSAFKQSYTDMIDTLIEGCQVPCTLIHGVTLFTSCPNCLFDAIGNKSANRYASGGPMPFTVGMCPMCHGVGKIPDEQTSTINLVPLWDSKDWVGVSNVSIGNPNEFVQTLSVIATFDNLVEAKDIIIDTGITNFTRNIFSRVGEPQPCGFGASNYIFTMWKRKS